MAASKQEILVAWLRDAYAMEMKAIDLMQGQVDRLRHYPEFETRLREHIAETRGQADLVKRCLARYNAEPSSLKDMTTRLQASLQAWSTMLTEDEVVKYALADYGFESFEIASYRSNIAAAENIGDLDTAADLRVILAQEERMQAWVHEHIPLMTLEYLNSTVGGGERAKR